MQLLHAISAILGGIGLSSLVLGLVAARGMGWRSTAGAFVVASLGYTLLCFGQLLRADTTTVAAMDLVVRLSQASGFVALWGILEVFRRAADAPLTRLHRIALGAAIGAATYAVASPGGILYERLLGVDVLTYRWGEALHVPIYRIEVGTYVALAVYLLACARLWSLAAFRWRAGHRLHGGLLFGATAAYAATLALQAATLLTIWTWQGPRFVEWVMLLIYAITAAQAAEAHERWAQERHRALERVRESEGKLAAVLGHGLTLAGLLTPDGRLAMANRRALEAIHAREEEVIGRPFAETPWWSHSESLRLRLARAIEGAAAGQASRFRATHALADGKVADIDFSITPYRDEAGAIRWLIVEGRDISDMVRLERRARDEQRLEVIGQLAGSIAHDFNNMLGGILGAAGLALQQTEDEGVRECLDIVVDGATRAAGLTKQLLTFARRGEGRRALVNTHELLASTVALFARMAGPKRGVDLSFDANVASVYTDPAQLQGAVMNLLVNARDATSEGGRITVSTQLVTLSEADARHFALPAKAGSYLQIGIEDTGSGIPDDVLPRIFEPFFTTKELGKGTGLGLASVLGFVRDMGGTLDVVTRVGQGTSFRLYVPQNQHATDNPSVARLAAAGPIAALPSAPAPAPASAPATAPATVPAGAEQQGSDNLALVVDDDPVVSHIVQRQLAQLGFAVHVAESAVSAQALLGRRNGPPAVALIAVHTPDQGGTDLAHWLRRAHPSLPIVLSSGNFSDAPIGELRSDPRVGLLAKPVRSDDLQEKLVELGVL